MMPKIVTLTFAGTLMLSAGPAASQVAKSPVPQSAQDQMTPVPSQPPELNQPSAVKATATEPVSKVANAERKLAAAKVQDMLGRPVGSIQMVHTSAAGTVTSAQVALNTQTEAGKTVNIPANQLMYDHRTGIVVAQLTQTEIDAMPATVAKPNASSRGY